MSIKQELDKLTQFLLKEYSDEIGLGSPKAGESAVEVAIRLLNEDRQGYNKGYQDAVKDALSVMRKVCKDMTVEQIQKALTDAAYDSHL